MTQRETRRFVARSGDGDEVEIIEYTTIRREFDMRRGPHEVENTMRQLVTSDGETVNPTDEEGVYLVEPLNLLVRAV